MSVREASLLQSLAQKQLASPEALMQNHAETKDLEFDD